MLAFPMLWSAAVFALGIAPCWTVCVVEGTAARHALRHLPLVAEVATSAARIPTTRFPLAQSSSSCRAFLSTSSVACHPPTVNGVDVKDFDISSEPRRPAKNRRFPSRGSAELRSSNVRWESTETSPSAIVKDPPEWNLGSWLRTLLSRRRRPQALRIGAYNVQSFGWKKSQNAPVMAALVDLISHYDILSVLEVRDGSGARAVQQLLDSLQAYCQGLLATEDPRAKDCDYDVLLSPRLGRTRSYQEQVAVFYRRKVVRPLEAFVHSDRAMRSFWQTWKGRLFPSRLETPLQESFHRVPFVTVFEQLRNKKKLMLMNVHLSPGAVVQEMDALADVYKFHHDRLRKQFQLDAALIIGDFNSDGPYMTSAQFYNSKMYQDASVFHWPQPFASPVFSSAPLGSTTTENTRDHVYDRVVLGQPYRDAMLKGSGRVYRWPSHWTRKHWESVVERWQRGGATPPLPPDGSWKEHSDAWQLAAQVSDHLPVEIQLDLSSKK